MIIENVSKNFLKAYLEDDWVSQFIESHAKLGDDRLRCQAWLRDSIPKRAIFSRLYGDLIDTDNRLRVLDVGGGITSATRFLAQKHDYNLVDILAHDGIEVAREIERDIERPILFRGDWYDLNLTGRYDIVIANDLFPNVDQRLEIFLSRILPVSGEVRLSLTYFNEPRFYSARRLDGDEIFFISAWNLSMMNDLLSRVLGWNKIGPIIEAGESRQSVFENGRSVCLLNLSMHDHNIE